ncbi:nickel-dependent hydrogenase large subunit [Patescibacteria group bacterium]
MAKTKIAFFGLTGCEGCEFQLLSLDEQLLDLFQDFEITHWRLMREDQKEDFDIAFVEGAATTPDHIKILKKIRQTSKTVVALGACALTGNVFAQLSPEQRKKLAPQIYNSQYRLKAEFLEPIEKFIKVDLKIPGCPPNLEMFKQFLAKLKKEITDSKIQDVKPPEYVAKIEGHGRLEIDFDQKMVNFQVEESERLIEGLLLGKDYHQAPFINARICGICPIAHNLCSWKAIEAALSTKPSTETKILRELLLSAQIIKSHLLHLFFLVLPDHAHLNNSLELSQKYPAEFHLMLNIKRVTEKILTSIGGTTSFPTNTCLGGFIKPPTLDQLLPFQHEITEVLDEALDLISLFAKLEPIALTTPVSFLTSAPINNHYPLYRSQLTPQIKEIVLNDSTAKRGLLPNGDVVKVGALARMAKYSQFLNPQAKKVLLEHQLNYHNPYLNNLAQAIEILHFLEEISKQIEVLKALDLKKSQGIKDFKVTEEVRGQACLEAPRGILIHQVKLSPEGKITNYNIIPPTQINLAALEKEAQQLVKEEKKLSEKEIRKEIEKLIRAFDPCITCAVH